MCAGNMSFEFFYPYIRTQNIYLLGGIPHQVDTHRVRTAYGDMIAISGTGLKLDMYALNSSSYSYVFFFVLNDYCTTAVVVRTPRLLAVVARSIYVMLSGARIMADDTSRYFECEARGAPLPHFITVRQFF